MQIDPFVEGAETIKCNPDFTEIGVRVGGLLFSLSWAGSAGGTPAEGREDGLEAGKGGNLRSGQCGNPLGLAWFFFMIAGIRGNFARVGGTREVQLAYRVEGCFDLGCLLGTLLSCTTVSARRRGPLEGESGRERDGENAVKDGLC